MVNWKIRAFLLLLLLLFTSSTNCVVGPVLLAVVETFDMTPHVTLHLLSVYLAHLRITDYFSSTWL